MAARPRARRWVAREHGAWAMLIAPLVTGIALGGAAPAHLLLVMAWVSAYLCYQTFTRWYPAAPRQRTRYRLPLIVYAVGAAAFGVPLLALEPRLLWWGPVFALLSAVGVVCVLRRAVRSLLNDLATQAAACLMTVVAFGLGPRVGDAGLPFGDAWVPAWVAAACLYAYFAGTSFYVKTMIRERGRSSWYVASVVYHGVVFAGAVLLGIGCGRPAAAWYAVIVGALLLGRAAVVPRRWPTAKPLAIGIGEFALTVLVIVAALLLAG